MKLECSVRCLAPSEGSLEALSPPSFSQMDAKSPVVKRFS